MNAKPFIILGLLAAMAVLALPAPGRAQPPVCPPGYDWIRGACRPIPPPPPPPRYAPPPPPPPRYAPPPPGYDPNIKQVARRYVTLRSCPGDGCPPTTTLSRGTPVRILAWEGPFVLVRVPDAPIEGWVKRRHLTP